MNITSHLVTLNLISCFIAHLLSLIISFGRPLFSLAWIPQCHLETAPSLLSLFHRLPVSRQSNVCPHSDPWRKLKIISLLVALTAWTQGLQGSFSGDITAGCPHQMRLLNFILDQRFEVELMSSLYCSTSSINSLKNYLQGLQVTLKATAGWADLQHHKPGWGQMAVPWASWNLIGFILSSRFSELPQSNLEVSGWSVPVSRFLRGKGNWRWKEGFGSWWFSAIQVYQEYGMSLFTFPKENKSLLRGESEEKPGEEIKKIHLQIFIWIISSTKVHNSSLPLV